MHMHSSSPNMDSMSCTDGVFTVSTDAHTLSLGADGFCAISQPHELTVLSAESGSGSDSDVVSSSDSEGDSAFSHTADDDWLTDSGCSGWRLPVTDVPPSQQAKRVSTVEPGLRPQHAQQAVTSHMDRMPAARILLQDDVVPESSTAIANDSAVSSSQSIKIEAKAQSVCASEEADLSESFAKLTAQGIRDRYPNLFRDQSAAVAAPAEAVAPAEAACSVLPCLSDESRSEAVAESSVTALEQQAELPSQPMVVHDTPAWLLLPAADAAMTADSRATESCSAVLGPATEGATAADNSNALSSQNMPETGTRSWPRAGHHGHALQQGLPRAAYQGSPLRQLLQDTNAAIATSLNTGWKSA